MKKSIIKKAGFVAVGLMLCVIPAAVWAQTEAMNTEVVPIEQTLVREGLFATRLDAALGLGVTSDEIAAESALGGVGIAPRNGWIADYPITPDILTELRNSVAMSVDSGWLALPKDEALNRFDDVAAGVGLSVTPYTASEGYEVGPDYANTYPDTTVINNYYNEEGPPVVTYFTPPPDFVYLYTWVPFPFLCSGFRFPGFFVLRDFHRPFFIDHHEAFVSNHFYDRGRNRVFRIDPAARFHGNAFAGIGAAHGSTHPAGTGVGRGGIYNTTRPGSGFIGRGGGNGNVPPGADIAGRAVAVSPTARGMNGSFAIPSGSRGSSSHPLTSRSYGRPTAGSGFHGPATFSGRSFASPGMSGRSFSMTAGSRGSYSYPGRSRSDSLPPSVTRVPSATYSGIRPSFPSSGVSSYAHNSWEGRSSALPSAGSGFHGPATFSGRSFASPGMSGRSFSMPSGGGFPGGGRR